MSIFKFFRKKEHNPSTGNYDYNIEDILNVPISERDDLWQKNFLASIIKIPLYTGLPATIESPDGLEYTNLVTAPNEHGAGSALKDIVLNNLSTGSGIVINGNKEEPDWTFSYGDVVDFFLNDEFYSGSVQKPFGGAFVTDKLIFEREARVGQPSESFLPNEARNVIRNFIKSFGITPKICLIHWIQTNELNLAFNILPGLFQNKDEEVFQSLLNFLGWYFPRHYVIISMNEDDSFEPL